MLKGTCKQRGLKMSEDNLTEPQNLGQETKEKLNQFVDRIERLEAEKAELAADIREVMNQVSSFGLDKKIVRKIISMRKQDESERAEQDMLIDLYMEALI